MVNFPPYLPSSEWMCYWLRDFVKSSNPGEAFSLANKSILSSRDFARTTILDTNDHPLILSCAVEGGGRRLRDSRNLRSVILSDHGNWRRIHPMAIEACYGRKPFYPYIADGLTDIYRDLSITGLEEFNVRLFDILSHFLLGRLDKARLNLFEEIEVLRNRGKEIAKEINPEISVLDPIMKFGPEAIFGIFALYN